MSNTVLNPSIIAKAAVRILDNELVFANRVFRGYEDEFEKKVNGYDRGDTISIRKPNQFTVRQNTAVASVQDVVEGKMTLQVANQSGVDFKFTSAELTLKISELAERVMKPGLVQLANYVDQQIALLYKDVYNWVGTPGQTIDAFTDWAKGPERLDLTAVPSDDRVGVMSPTDHWAIAGAQTALYMQDVAKNAYRKGRIGELGDVETYKSQNIQTHTTGALAGSPLVNGASQNVAYTSVLNTESVPGIQSLITDGWTAATTIKKGDVFTIASVFAVNPVTKATLNYLQQFVVQADVTADGSGNATLSIAPAIITSGAFQSVSAVPADNAVITPKGTGATGYPQNLIFHRNAFALVMVPMIKPPGSVDCARESYKGINVRVIPVYDGTNDVSQYRLDILFGAKTVDPRLATRISGT